MSPRNSEQNQQIRDERREQILQAALRVFAQKGLTGAKISDISNAAGLSYGLIYHYFESKDEIFTELVRIAKESSLGVFKAAAELPGTPVEKLQSLTDMILSGAYQDEGPLYFYIMIQAMTSDAIPQEVREIVFGQQEPSYLNYLIPTLVEGQQLGQVVEEEPIRLAVLFLAIIQGLAIVQMPNAESIPLPSVETVMRIFRK